MNKKFYTYSGAEFFEDYMLITNPTTKNKHIKEFISKIGYEKSYTLIDEKGVLSDKLLLDRYNAAKRLGMMHSISSLVSIIPTGKILSSGELVIGVSLLTMNILINVYPTIIQVNIRDRCKKILMRKGFKNT